MYHGQYLTTHRNPNVVLGNARQLLAKTGNAEVPGTTAYVYHAPTNALLVTPNIPAGPYSAPGRAQYVPSSIPQSPSVRRWDSEEPVLYRPFGLKPQVPASSSSSPWESPVSIQDVRYVTSSEPATYHPFTLKPQIPASSSAARKSPVSIQYPTTTKPVTYHPFTLQPQVPASSSASWKSPVSMQDVGHATASTRSQLGSPHLNLAHNPNPRPVTFGRPLSTSIPTPQYPYREPGSDGSAIYAHMSVPYGFTNTGDEASFSSPFSGTGNQPMKLYSASRGSPLHGSSALHPANSQFPLPGAVGGGDGAGYQPRNLSPVRRSLTSDAGNDMKDYVAKDPTTGEWKHHYPTRRDTSAVNGNDDMAIESDWSDD